MRPLVGDDEHQMLASTHLDFMLDLRSFLKRGVQSFCPLYGPMLVIPLRKNDTFHPILLVRFIKIYH